MEPLFKHQIEGIELLVKNPRFALFDEMGTAKTRQVIEAAERLYREGKVGTVLVFASAAGRAEWDHPVDGQIEKWIE